MTFEARPTHAPPLTLDSGRIDVWCTFVDDVNGFALVERCYQLLSASERLRLERFRFERDRHQHLVTRALVRSTLSRYVSIAPAHWAFHAEGSGRPAITNPNPSARHISFNVSHTDGLVVCAVTAHAAIGVDAENTGARDAPLDVAARFFAPEEAATLNALRPGARQTRFFEHWTLKESYAKARSLGLSLPLCQCICRFGPRTSDVSVEADSCDGRAWWFWRVTFADTFAIGLCSEHRTGQRPHVTVRRVIPLGSAPQVAFNVTPVTSATPADALRC